MRKAACPIALLVGVMASTPALAQNWSFDARTIALGGVSGGGNVAVDMVDEQRPYRAIVLPFGLIQVLPNIGKLNPTEDDFDLVRAIEYAASPIHYIVGRDTTDTGQQFVTDIRNARLNRDLNVYRGFVPANDILAEGLASPSWGGTIKFRSSNDGAFQGIYIGAGPYLSAQTNAIIDPALTALLGNASPTYVPNGSFSLDSATVAQTALAVTGGYRARIAWPDGGSGGATAHGFNGTTVRGGFEQRFGRVQLRGGGRYVRERFEPSGGAGFNLSDHVGLDVAAFATSANFERKRHLAIAASIRLMRQTQ